MVSQNGLKHTSELHTMTHPQRNQLRMKSKSITVWSQFPDTENKRKVLKTFVKTLGPQNNQTCDKIPTEISNSDLLNWPDPHKSQICLILLWKTCRLNYLSKQSLMTEQFKPAPWALEQCCAQGLAARNFCSKQVQWIEAVYFSN